MLLKDPRWLTRLGSCSPDWNPGYTLSYTIWSEICLTENCCRSQTKSCTNLGFLKNMPVSTYGICSCFYTVESYIYHITWCILDVVHEYKQKRLWTCKIWINLNASAAFGAIRKLGHGALAEMCGCLLWQYCAGLVFFYKFIWSTDDSSWVVACSCCRVFSIKCGFNIIIIYMFSFLVEWWISTLVVASDLLLLVVYLLHPCMGRALPSWAEKHV